VSDEEAALLAAREIVVRSVASEGGTAIVAIVDVAAPPLDVLDAVLDVEARVDEVGPISKCEVYVREPERLGARFEVTVLGSVTAFHVLYTIDRDGLRTTYDLDRTRPNDLDQASGAYEVFARGSGSRLVYTSGVEAQGYVPQWLKSRVTSGPLVEQLGGIRARAER
jgi:hypothetical protein